MSKPKRTYKPYLEEKLARALDAVCEIEDVTLFDYARRVDDHNVLHYEVVIYRQTAEDITLSFPILTIATNSSQWITIQVLKACGWQKAEVSQ